jgi:hypothetical protein
MCVKKTPLAEVFHFFPGNGARKLVGGAAMVYEINEVNDRPVGKPQEKVLMNIAASFPSVKKPRYIDHEKSRQYD